MKEIRNLIAVVLTAVFFIALFIMCDRLSDKVIDEYSSQINPSLISNQSEGDPNVDPGDIDVANSVMRMVESDYSIDMKITISGEILCQNQQLAMAFDPTNSSFSFEEGLKYLKEDLSEGELSLATLGTTLAGSGNGYSSDMYGYCAQDGMYNSPEVLADDLKNAGISLISTASRHSLDSGIKGLFTTIDNLDNAKLSHIGTYKAENSSREYEKKVNYADIVFTAYTNSTNDQELPEDSGYTLNTLGNMNTGKINEMCKHITQLADAYDYVVVMINFGSADSAEIESEQKRLAEKMAQAGADLIIGTGSRAVKPMDIITVTGSNGLQRRCTVFYGLGCIYSSDYYSEYEKLDTDIAMIINLTLRNSISGKVIPTQMEVKPIYLNWYNDLVQPISVCRAKDSDEYKELLDEADMLRIDSAYDGAMGHFLGNSGLKFTYDKNSFSYKVDLTKTSP